MNSKLHDSWRLVLAEDLKATYFSQLSQFVKNEYELKECYPPDDTIFSAFNYCRFEDVKVVIIGQDPYHGFGQANGLCFSVQDGIKHPPSLINIFKELGADLNMPYPQSGDLSPWANQGVLLLNAILTVEKGNAGSHKKKGWEQFTDAVIELTSEQKKDVVFILWGGYAQKKGAKIDETKHLVLKTGHPSPLSANRGFWFKNKHFSKCNAFLKNAGKQEIDWTLQ